MLGVSAFHDVLYLEKDVTGDILVPCSRLAPHQIAGLRFLFRQYKKETPGVIFNLPSGSGTSILVAVYITAICETLKRPVLILYDDEKERERWRQRFNKWTSINENSIEFDTSNPFLRKHVFISSTADVVKLQRRDWGIVVVKSEEFNNILQKCQLKTDFKIWIIAQDLKDDNQLLRSVYTWINPSDSLLQQYLDNKPTDLFGEEIPNFILLDMLLEEVMFTTSTVNAFSTAKRKHEPDIPNPPVVSKKNKDATGKKIKRSKKPPDVPSTSETATVTNTTVDSYNNDGSVESLSDPKNSNADKAVENTTTHKAIIDSEEPKMDVESFIRDNDPLVSDSSLCYAVRNLDNISQHSKTKSPKLGEELFNFKSAVDDIVVNENSIILDDWEKSSKPPCVEDKENDLTPVFISSNDVEVNDTDVISKVCGTKIDNLKTPLTNTSDEENPDFKVDLDNQEIDVGTSEQKSTESKNNGASDQVNKLEVSTNVLEETDNSFDSKMKKVEEKALKKFKGSILDNIF